MSNEEQQLLEKSASEIRMLRSQNQVLSARLNMFDQMMVLLNTQPHQVFAAAGRDIAYEIDRYVKGQQSTGESNTAFSMPQ